MLEIRQRTNAHLWVDQLHDGLLQVVQVHGVLRGGPGNDIVGVVAVTAERGKFFGIGEFYVNSVFLHDPLNALASHTDDSLVVGLRNMERNLSWQFLLK